MLESIRINHSGIKRTKRQLIQELFLGAPSGTPLIAHEATSKRNQSIGTHSYIVKSSWIKSDQKCVTCPNEQVMEVD